MIRLMLSDVRAKARWCYADESLAGTSQGSAGRRYAGDARVSNDAMGTQAPPRAA